MTLLLLGRCMTQFCVIGTFQTRIMKSHWVWRQNYMFSLGWIENIRIPSGMKREKEKMKQFRKDMSALLIAVDICIGSN